MIITMKEPGMRFGARVGAIIYNEAHNKVFIEKQRENLYRFPGGRIDIHEDSQHAITRELYEELDITLDCKLKYVLEMFVASTKTKYHEIGFYYLCQMDEKRLKEHMCSHDGDSVFEWIPVEELHAYPMLETPIQEKVIRNDITDTTLKHIVYREYES